MSILVALRHTTQYQYDRPVKLFPHVIRLRPAPHTRTPILSYSLKVTPEEHFVNWQQDPFGNFLARFVFPEKTTEFSFEVELIADMSVINPFDFFLEDDAKEYPIEYEPLLTRDLAPYLAIQEDGPQLKAWLVSVDHQPRSIVDFLVAINARLASDVKYLVRMEPGVQTCEQTLTIGSGSCRDTAWLLVQICRHLGLAARFVSGYLVQLTADIKALDGPSGTETDFTDLHAWAEVYLPGAGWIGLDPTSGLLAGEGHIPLAATPEPQSAAPVTGSVDSAKTEFSFSNTVTRIHEDPRVTKPLTEDQWADVLHLGDKVEEKLQAQDVRLTMGGEPTFVSIDNMDGEEWNYTALSEEKEALALNLLERLRGEFGANGVLHIGQGKWYPGEPLPRWAFSLFWRVDGKPVVADARQFLSGAQAPAKACAEDTAARFTQALAQTLGLPPEYAVAAYEDVRHYLQEEAKLPLNVSIEDNKLESPLERARLRRVFKQGLGHVVGYALPIKWHEHASDPGWQTSHWQFRDEHMFLVPGDSAMGYRLPLNSLQWQAEQETSPPTDPFAHLPPLADVETSSQHSGARQPGSETVNREIIFHTALCVERRDEHLYVFLPPEEDLERYIMLLNAVGAVAQQLDQPVVLEGYPPPRDRRLKMLQITPDPGVIEVNIHPAANWREVVNNTTVLYEQARQARLGTEKFMLDGRHTGTGGGNHVTLGAMSAADSPFLRRPDLLRSFITYWQRHPSLSYLFSGTFIGPTSQAPRVDEARDDHLYELEIALSLLPEGDVDQLWQVDRILRNFLVDLTGNTHRAEFCIDKLYSPATGTGRLGLVELRAFEMPPHAHMSALQILLVRALLAWFWKQPHQAPLIRWGTQLHDRFMLRHFIAQDFAEVLYDLKRSARFNFDPQWFDAFFEFRFPLIGRFKTQGMQVEIHNALEPWHVLGEESSTQGTARYVDSSVERVQVTFRDQPSDRYIVTCNGRAIPLRPTDEQGTSVGAVRFKAWEQHSSLHPTIKPHMPLVFDIVDTRNSRSIAGATYHAGHPGGRNYDTFPLNANEAEARRGVRFLNQGGSQGKMKLRPPQVQGDQPYTLDLRIPD